MPISEEPLPIPVQNTLDLVAERIRFYRRSQRLDQKEVAKRAGISHFSLSCLERGKSAMTLRSLIRISFALGIEPVKLFESPKTLDEIAPRYARGFQPRKGHLSVKRRVRKD